MRATLLLALLAVPVVCSAVPRPAAAQRGHRVYAWREGRGYRDRIYVDAHRYREPGGRYRYRAVVPDRYRYRDEYRYRDDDRYRDEYRYRDQDRYRDRDRYRYDRRRHVNVLDLVLLAAEARYRDRYTPRHRSRSRHGGLYIEL